jgi:hypothetical protein
MSWAAELRGDRRREGNDVPYLANLIAVSSLVWED